MRNRSSRSNKEVLELILYVRQYSKCSDHVKITVDDHDNNGIDGTTQDFVEESVPMDVRVKVFLDDRYPCVQTSPIPSLPKLELHNWKEHLVLTLGHELRHAWQFENRETSRYSELKRSQGGDEQIELDAESYGIRILKQYRWDHPWPVF